MAHDFENGEHRDEWPAQDRPFAADDSDAPVSLGAGDVGDEAASGDQPVDETVVRGEEAGERPFEGGPDASAEPDTPAEPGPAADSDSATWSAITEPAPTGGAGTVEDQPVDEAVVQGQAAGEHLLGEQAPEEWSAAPTEGGGQSETVELRNSGARDIDATTVSITQGGARDVEATTVTINQGGAGRIRADELNVTQGGVGLARTDRLTIHEGGSAFAVVADNATLDPETSVFMLVARSTTGDVRPFLDWRAAAAFGAAFALVLRLLRRRS